MSRAPRHETSIPMHAAVNPYGIIDFVDGNLGAQPPPGAIIGGPPAFLEAHGIRYVPVSALSAEEPEPAPAPARTDARLVPMGRSEPLLAEAAPPITRRDLDARVDQRIQRFLQRDAAAATSSRIRALREELEEEGLGDALEEPCERGRRTSKRLEALREEAEAASRMRTEAVRGDARGKLKTEARPAAASTTRKLEALRAQIDASAKRAPPPQRARQSYDF